MESKTPPDRPPSPEPEEHPPEHQTTAELLTRARTGDSIALDRICERLLPPLRRWARGRLPQWARDGVDTDDIVQQTVLDTVGRIDAFQPRYQGALQVYARQALNNRIRDEIKRARRHPVETDLDSGHADPAPSPLEEAVGREALERYESALLRLSEETRSAVLLRIEYRLSYREIAKELGKPSENAARMMVTRALIRLAQEMGRGE